ncbi:MAG: chemotaxis protein CheW [Myxococcota bacterium]|nr:chemotaxis protein CheW [Myxococcota bacterium]
MKPVGTAEEENRLLSFDVGGSIYALPIACVAEVSEIGGLVSIPTLPSEVAGVMNHHGDALPILQRTVLLDMPEPEAEPAHALLMTPWPGGSARFGIFVDRILGLVAGQAARAEGPSPIAEQRSIGGRVVFVLDPECLFARAGETIDAALERSA